MLSDPKSVLRLRPGKDGLNAPFGAQCFPTVRSEESRPFLASQCTFWCSVLSDLKPGRACIRLTIESQCTFWCSVLSDEALRLGGRSRVHYVSMHLLVLSAFRLYKMCNFCRDDLKVSMHLLVLSAFRLVREESGRLCRRRRVSMHLLVLSAFRPTLRLPNTFALQVSMHLLVLSAFRQFIAIPDDVPILSLNAPFGAQCFPTGRRGRGLEPQGPVSMHLLVLSAFRRIGSRTRAWRSYVSMHLLVLSAFRQGSS